MHHSLRHTVVALGAVGLVSALAPAALAHDVVVGGNPADGETLEQFPSEVVLEFSGIPKEGFNTFAISDVDSGEVLFSGEPTVEERNVSLELPADLDPGAGEYTIGFQITSSDGHSTRGMTSFTVAGEAAQGEAAQRTSAQSSAAETATPTSEDTTQESEENGLGTGATIAIAVVAVLALLAVVVAALQRNRVRKNLDEN